MIRRGFEVVKRLENDEDSIRLPERSTGRSAGHDFFAVEDITIEPVLFNVVRNWVGKFLNMGFDNYRNITPTLVRTGIKAYMLEDEALMLYNRSSNPKKLGLILANGVGVVDSDYYNNPDNDGEIGFLFYNLFPFSVTIKAGEKIGQGVFQKFLKADNDCVDTARLGGYGSTGR